MKYDRSVIKSWGFWKYLNITQKPSICLTDHSHEPFMYLELLCILLLLPLEHRNSCKESLMQMDWPFMFQVFCLRSLICACNLICHGYLIHKRITDFLSSTLIQKCLVKTLGRRIIQAQILASMFVLDSLNYISIWHQIKYCFIASPIASSRV